MYVVREQTEHRSQRAAAARVLKTLFDAGQLQQPEIWTWQVLDTLPAWCLYTAEKCKQLQLVCGILLLGPELQYWLDRSWIVAARNLVTANLYDDICVNSAARTLSADAPAMGSLALTDYDDSLPLESRMEQLLLTAGAAVLGASLHPSIPNEMRGNILGEAVCELPFATAIALLTESEQLIVAHSDHGETHGEATPANDLRVAKS